MTNSAGGCPWAIRDLATNNESPSYPQNPIFSVRVRAPQGELLPSLKQSVWQIFSKRTLGNRRASNQYQWLIFENFKDEADFPKESRIRWLTVQGAVLGQSGTLQPIMIAQVIPKTPFFSMSQSTSGRTTAFPTAKCLTDTSEKEQLETDGPTTSINDWSLRPSKRKQTSPKKKV